MSYKDLIYTFFKKKESLEDKAYLKYTIMYSCAPTLYETKPASILSFKKGKKNLLSLWNTYKEELTQSLNISYIELHQRKDCICVLFYKKNYLTHYLQDEDIKNFLSNYGYIKGANLESILTSLKKNYNNGCCPDEIGIFLGYPLKDIKSYIAHGGKNFCKCRYWKVYHNEKDAEKIFDSYDKSKVSVMEQLVGT